MPVFLKGLLPLHIVVVMLGLLFWSAPQRCFAQQNKTVPVEIEIKDGSVVKGKVLRTARDTLWVVDDYSREWKISFKDIRKLDYVDSTRVSKRWPEPPNSLRYLLGSTAIPLRRN